MGFKKGDRVMSQRQAGADWGLGEVLADSAGDKVHVFFVNSGEKTLSIKGSELKVILGEEAVHPVLDNLKIKKSSAGIKYQSLAESTQYFLSHFPEGFYGSGYAEKERGYKEKAHGLACELLGKSEFLALLQREEFGELKKRALKVVAATNLIFPNEKMALADGLVDATAQRRFAIALYDLLFGDGELRARFEAYSKVLEEIGAAKWPLATYFLFIVRPKDYMFVKPTILQHASELCGFEINYKPELNWLTYDSVLKFSEYLRGALSELRPRDMIDVSSFMWCIAPGSYDGS